jgi:Protein of unknown function (DUF2878)
MAISVGLTGTAEMTAVAHRQLPWYPLVHLAAYQVTWFAAIMGGASGRMWPGLLAGGLMLALHVAVSDRRQAVVNRLALATLFDLGSHGHDLVYRLCLRHATVVDGGVVAVLRFPV